MHGIVSGLLAAVALAQPAVNAPLLPQYNYITGSGSDAVVSAVVVGVYAFTADTNGVWGANVQGSSNDIKPFRDALPGVTQLWSWCINVSDASTCAVHAIAGPAVALYRMNDTAIWRAAIFQATNATFDIISDSRSPSYMYPVVLPNAAGTSAFFVLGTRNTSNVPSATYLPSTVYAFDVCDLSVTWSTVVNSDTTSFSTANCTDFVWILTQNQTYGFSDVVVRKLDPRYGILLDWSFDSSISSSNTNIGVANGQFMVLGSGGYLSLAFYNGTVITLDYSIPTSCYTMPFAPTLIGTTWYAICGAYVEMWSLETGQQLTPLFASRHNIRCAAIHVANGDIVLSGSSGVYVGNASGIWLLVDLPNSIYSNGPNTCTGARFNWFSRTDIVHLSYTSYYSGSVLALNYRTGEVVYQAAVDVTPFGPAVVDWKDQRLFVSSTSGHVLQSYEFVSTNADTTSFVSALSGSATQCSVAYNATSRITYYISTYNLYTVDWTGAVEQVATFNGASVNLMPLLVGQYLVFCDSYYDKVYVYDSATKVLTALSVDDVDTSAQPYVFGMTVVVFGTDSSIAAAVIDLSAATIAAVSITADSYRQVSGAALVGATLLVNTGTSTVTGFNTTVGTYTAPLFVLNQFNLVQSPPTSFDDLGYFIA